MSEHVRNLRDEAERIDRLNGPIWASRLRAGADYIEELEERLRITNELLEAKQEPNNAE